MGSAVGLDSLAVQADGKIVAAGHIDTSPRSFLLARLTPAGALDTSFGSDGFVTTGFANDEAHAEAVLIQSDGKLVAAGTASVGGDYDFAVARFHPDGALDTAYSGDGKVTIGFGASDRALDAALQSDGKLVIAGGSAGLTDQDFAVARLNADGTLDSGFDGDGKLTTGFGDTHEAAAAVAIQADGRIVVAGDDQVARYLSGGGLDASFDGDGKRTIGSAQLNDLALQPDGKLLLIGTHYAPGDIDQFSVWRLNANATQDSTFSGDGDVYSELGTAGKVLALLPDGRLLALGYVLGGGGLLLQLRPDGAFDAGGQQTLGYANPFFGLGSDEIAQAMAIQLDGKIVLAGAVLTPDNTEGDLALARFLPGGHLDTDFGDQGRVWFGFGQYDAARAVAVQPDGKIVVAGYVDPAGVALNDFLVVRFNPDGTKDQGFGLLGFNLVNFMGGDDNGNALALAPDGKIVVAGSVWNGARYVIGVARFTSDGFLDGTFDGDGRLMTEWIPGLPAYGMAVAIQPDGKILLGGQANDDFALMRLAEDGSLDLSFGAQGVTITDMGGFDTLNALALTSGGWLYAAGSRDIDGNTDFAIAQYTPNGVLGDYPVGWAGGKVFVDWGGAELAFGVDVRADGQVVAAGCSQTGFAWAQLPPQGVRPSPLKRETDFAGSGECALGVRFAGTHHIVAAGVQQFNGDRNMALARFETTVDATAPVVYRLYVPLAVR
jgi:uncharacterized delta-60 repeat protein